MEWLKGFLESPFWAYAIAFSMLVIGAIFVIIYSADIATRKDLHKQAAYFNSLLEEKDREIARLTEEKRRIGGERFALEMQLKTANTILGNNAHKVNQLIKGAKNLGIDVDNE